MSRFWLVCRYEYLRHVRRFRFLFALFSMPLMLLFLFGVAILAVLLELDGSPVGVVDLAGVLSNPQPVPRDQIMFYGDPEYVMMANETAARQALEAKEVQCYFVLLPGYLEEGSAQYVTLGQSKETTEAAFKRFLRYNLIFSQPPELAQRLLEGPQVEIRSLDGSRRMRSDNLLGLFMPMVVGMLFLLVVNTSGSYLVGALVEEKENRTMEIVITSISPGQLMAGKVVGNLAVGLTELLAWVLFGIAALSIWKIIQPPAESLPVDFGFLWLSFFTLLPAFVMVAGLMATAGVTTADPREAQQVAGLFTLPLVIPFWLMLQLMQAPNSPLAIGLSLFPLTAPISLPTRVAFTDVPGWQIAISLGLLVLSAAAAIWLASRAFRLGMLRYGKKITWRELFGKA